MQQVAAECLTELVSDTFTVRDLFSCEKAAMANTSGMIADMYRVAPSMAQPFPHGNES